MPRALPVIYDVSALDPASMTQENSAKTQIRDGLKLKESANWISGFREYSSTADLGTRWSITLPEITIGAFAGLLVFDAVETLLTDRKDDDGLPLAAPGGSTIQATYQLVLNGTPYWWSGVAWVAAAGNADANPLATVQSNIGHASLLTAVRAAGNKIAPKVLLETSVKTFTRRVSEVRLLVEVSQLAHDATDANGPLVGSSIDDAIVRTLVPSLEAIEFPGAWRDVAPSGGLASIDLLADAIRREVPIRYSSVTAVYDITADPTRSTNLKTGAFSTTTSVIGGVLFTGGVISLTSPIPAGNSYRVEFTWTAAANVTTHRDFAGVAGYEIASIPEIQIRDPDVESELIEPDLEFIELRADPGAGVDDAYMLTGRRTLALVVTIAPRAQIGWQVDAMAEGIRAWLGRTRLITSAAYGLPMVVEVRDAGITATVDPGLYQRHDLTIALYSVRETGTATRAKLARTVQINESRLPAR